MLDVDGAFYTPPSAFLHTAPVLEGVGYEAVGGNGSIGVVPVLHAHGGQVYFGHKAVCAKFAKGYPVANTYNIIDRNLNACHKPQDGILKDEQNNRRGRPQGSQGNYGIAREQLDDPKNANAPGKYHQHLYVALHGLVVVTLVFAQKPAKAAQDTPEHQYAEHNEVHLRQHLEDICHKWRFHKYDGNEVPDQP